MVTAGTYLRRRLLHNAQRLQLVHDALLATAAEFGWELQAWAVLANHYHFLALSPRDEERDTTWGRVEWELVAPTDPSA
ncbi:MAG: hypothetical protein FJ290_18420 [Planctomycetes bacterium]|nr:hypothetical protein [Planctomycetota bacterium]